MKKLRIPFFYHPAQVLFLDDDLSFIKSFQMLDNSVIKTFVTDKPNLALDLINRQSQEITPLDFLYYPEEEKDSNLITIFDIPSFHKKILNSVNHHQKIIAAFIDYDMPSMNGLAFCNIVNNQDVKKILLTGYADEKIAVNAFNQRLIDFYINKTNLNLLELVESLINQSALDYFCSVSEKLSIVFPEDSYIFNILNHEIFYNQFQKLVNELNITEYYLIDQFGSFILLNNHSMYVLNAFLESEISTLLESRESDSASQEVKDTLAKKEALICHKYLFDATPEGSYWHNIMEPITFSFKLSRENVYFSYTKFNIAPKTTNLL